MLQTGIKRIRKQRGLIGVVIKWLFLKGQKYDWIDTRYMFKQDTVLENKT